MSLSESDRAPSLVILVHDPEFAGVWLVLAGSDGETSPSTPALTRA